jgi:flagellar protein FliS
MFGTTKSGASAYAKVSVETGVMAATPHKLIVMLFDGAVAAVRSALVHMQAGNIPEKGKAISKAIQIIENGLRASLDRKAGGEISENLDALYEYMQHRLLIANAQNAPEILEEVQRLLNELREAWNAIGAPANSSPDAAPVAAMAGA